MPAESLLKVMLDRVGNRVRPGVYFKTSLIAISHAMEDHVLTYSRNAWDAPEESRPMIFATFQLGKYYLYEVERYRELAARSRYVVVMAGEDSGFEEGHTDNLSTLPIDASDPLSLEWHLVIISPLYTACLMCRDMGDDPELGENMRRFTGFWSFDPSVVRDAIGVVIGRVMELRPALALKLMPAITEALRVDARREVDPTALVDRVVHYLQNAQKELARAN